MKREMGEMDGGRGNREERRKSQHYDTWKTHVESLFFYSIPEITYIKATVKRLSVLYLYVSMYAYI